MEKKHYPPIKNYFYRIKLYVISTTFPSKKALNIKRKYFFWKSKSHKCKESIILIQKFYKWKKCNKGRNSPSEVPLRKGVLKICSTFTGEHTCRSAISIMLLCSFTEITLQHGCSPVNLLHIFRTSFPKNTYEGMYVTVFHILSFLSIHYRRFEYRVKVKQMWLIIF